jgi:hypothetical protein
MMSYTKSFFTGRKSIQDSLTSGARLRRGTYSMKRALSCVFVPLVLVATAIAGELPSAPSSVMNAMPAIVIATPAVQPTRVVNFRTENKVIDQKFIALSIVSAGSTFADSYTTLFARENWLAGKTNVCNAEVESAYLYGTHPTVARAYAVASVKTVGSIAASYYLRKHHSKLWSVPLIGNAISSLQGTTQNMIACN